MQMREKVGKSQNTVFPMIWGSGGSKSRLAKAAGAEPAGQMSDEKLHAVVARSTFRSQNVQKTPGPDHFWQLRCRKSARRCGAKHISKSKCTKHTSVGPLLEVQMSLCRFASLHYTTLHYTTLHYTTLHYTTLHNTTTTTTQLDYTPLHSTTLNFTTLHYTTLRSTTLHYIKLLYTPLHYITLHYAPQHYNYNYTTTLHYTTLHYITLQYTE